MSESNFSNEESIPFLKARISDLEALIAGRDRQQNLMISSLFHDIKNPLSVALGSLQVARMVAGNGITAKVARLLDSAEEASRSQLSIIQNLADQIKIEMGELILLEERFIPGQIVSKRFDHLQQMESRKEFYYDDDFTGKFGLGDSHAFERAIVNILDNCVKHTHRGGRVFGDVTVDELAMRWVLTISDNGELLMADQYDAIFDRHRTPATGNLAARRDIGLGLAYARTAVRAMKGELTATGNGETGARFVLSIGCAE